MPLSNPAPRRRMFNILAALTFVVALLIVIGGFAIFRTIDIGQSSRSLARESAMVMTDATGILGDLTAIESSQRGFLLTQDESYLTFYDIERDRALAALERLRGLGGTSPDRDRILNRVLELARAKIEEMAHTIEVARSGDFGEATRLVGAGTGRNLMDGIRAEVTTILETERIRLDRRYQEVDKAQHRTFMLVAVLVAAALTSLVIAGLAMMRSAQAEAKARYLNEIRAQRDRADLVRRELSHRVKNLFAVIMSIISTTGRTETDAREAARKTRDRVQALARAHAVSTGQAELRDAYLHVLVEAVVAPYAPLGHKLRSSGPEVILSPQTVTPLGLILNELATNALKYGGWAHISGTVSIRWQLLDTGEIDILWEETGDTIRGEPAANRGFGTTMIDLSAEQAGGEVERSWQVGIFQFKLKLPAVNEETAAQNK